MNFERGKEMQRLHDLAAAVEKAADRLTDARCVVSDAEKGFVSANAALERQKRRLTNQFTEAAICKALLDLNK